MLVACSSGSLGSAADARAALATPQTGFGTSRKTWRRPKRSARCSPRRRTPKRLGGVVAGGDQVHAELAGERHRALGRLAGEERVRARGGRLGQVVGARAGDDRERCARAPGPRRSTSGSRAVAARDPLDELADVDALAGQAARGSRSAGRGAAPNGHERRSAPSARASSALLPSSGWASSGRW